MESRVAEKNELEEKIDKWINENGYPLEMYTARFFQQIDYIVNQSEIYDDPESGKPREIDVVAYKNRYRNGYQNADEGESGATITTGCCIECKTSHDKPWIIFSNDNPFGQTFSFFFQSTKFGCQFHNSIDGQSEKFSQVHGLNSIYPAHCGYAITQAFTNGADVPYQAVFSAVKATIATVQNQSLIHPFWGAALPFYFPIVVLDGRLFDCYLNDENNTEIVEIDYGTLWWNIPLPGHSPIVVQIYTKKGLGKISSWLEKVGLALAGCDQQLIEIGKEILDAYHQNQS
jgi:hypothetical protein